MRLLFILTIFLSVFFVWDAEAQLRPVDSQYYSEHNALENAGFENGNRAWTLGSGNTLAFGSTELLNQHGSVSVSGNVLDISQSTVNLTPFAGNSGVARCRINTSNTGISFQLLNNSAVVSELDVVGDGSWKRYEIPFVADGTLNAIKIASDSSTVATVLIDDCHLELRSTTQFIPDSLTDWQPFTPTGSWVANTTYTGSWRQVGDSLEMQVTISLTGAPTAVTLDVDLPFGLEANQDKMASSGNENVLGYGWLADAGTAANRTGAKINLLGADPTILRLQGNGTNPVTNTTPFTFASGDWISFFVKIPIVGWSSGNATITSQDTELTIDTANTFTATIAPTTTVVSENFDWISSITNPATGQYNIVTNLPTMAYGAYACDANSLNHGKGFTTVFVGQPSTGSLTVYTYDNAGVSYNSTFSLTCTRITDYNKSQTIVGKFENINDTPLIVVKAKNNGGESLTADVTNIVWSDEDEDDHNTWNGSQFTSPRDTCYDINATVRTTANLQPQMRVFIDGVSAGHIKSATSSYIIQSFIFDKLCLLENQVLSFRTNTASTLLADVSFHRLIIEETPNLSAVVKNLATDSKIEQQKKYLQANVSSNGTIPDLQFDNLTIGKKYRITINVRMLSGGSNCTVWVSDGALNALQNKLVNDAASGEDRYIQTSVNPSYTATTATFVANFSETGSCVLEGSASNLENYTWITVEELSGNYVETEKH